MPQIILASQSSGAKRLDGQLKKEAFTFLEKLQRDDRAPGLHIEPINGVVDPRVRTGRVTDGDRAVLFRLQGQGPETHYVFLGVWPHDDAIKVARRVRLTVNPVNGIAEVIERDAVVEEPAARKVETPAPERKPDATALLASFGLTVEALVDDLGLDGDLAARAMQAGSEDALMALAADAVQWQGMALLDLATGRSLQEVKDSLGIGPPPPEAPQVIEALQHPAARMQFTFVEDNDELRRVIEDETFQAWRVFLHPEQRKYATRPYNGAFRLSGGAGTGKTVVLVHRARHLAHQDPDARILLTTFTRTLAAALRRDLAALDPEVLLAETLGDPGVHVCSVDSAVSAVLRRGDAAALDIEAVLGTRGGKIDGRTDATQRWQEAIDTVGGDLPADLRSPGFFVAEYAVVVLPGRLRSLEEYLRVRRPGRGVSLDRRRRSAVWTVVEAYRARSGVAGSVDFTEAAAIAAARLQRWAQEGGGVLLDHVLVDEGQDLNPSQWQFLRALVAEGRDDLFLAEDSHQRIYGQRVVLGRLGIRVVGRSQRLTLNYRTTAQNLRYAVRVLEGGEYVDLEDEPEQARHYRSARTGPAPKLVEASDLTEALEAAADTVRSWLVNDVAPETVGILVRDAQQAGQVARGLEDRGVTVRVVEREAVRSGSPQVMTMHRAKGMEFSCVLIFGVGADAIPAKYLLKHLDEADKKDLLLRERSLLYVAATRARDALALVWTGEPSELLPDRGVEAR